MSSACFLSLLLQSAKEIALMDSLSFAFKRSISLLAASILLPDFHFLQRCLVVLMLQIPIASLIFCVLRFACSTCSSRIFCAFRELISVVDGFVWPFPLQLAPRASEALLFSIVVLAFPCCAAYQIFLISMIASCCSASGRSATDGSSSILWQLVPRHFFPHSQVLLIVL